MKSQRAASIFALLVACYLPACFGQTAEEYIFIKIDPLDKSSSVSILSHSKSCQTCLIDKAAVSVASFEIITSFVSSFKIRSRIHGFKLIQIYCNFDTVCPNMYPLRLRDHKTSKLSTGIDGATHLPSVVHADLLEYLRTATPSHESSRFIKRIIQWTRWIQGTQLMKYSIRDEDFKELLQRYTVDVPSTPMLSSQNSDSIATGKSKDTLLFVAQQRDKVTADCRSCIRQASGSDSLGEFPIVKHKVDYILYVLRTSVSRNDIIRLCRSCEMPKVYQYNDLGENPYEIVHIHGVAKYHHSRTIGRDAAINNEKLKVEKLSNNDHKRLACVGLSSVKNSENINKVMKTCIACLAGSGEATFVHWMNAGAEPPQYAYLLFSFLSSKSHKQFEEKLPDTTCGTTCPNLALVPTEECYKDYYAQFEATPASEGQISASASMWNENQPTLWRKESVCVMAYYSSPLECSACLDTEIKTSSKFHSDVTSMKSVSSENIIHLGKCISDKTVLKCDKIVLFPKEMCNFWDMQKNMPPSEHESQFSKVDEKSKHLNVEKERNIEGKKLQESTPAASSSHESQHESHLTHHNLPVIIVRVLYRGPKCAACFLLVHEVLVVSTEPRYVWMVEPKNDARHCDCPYEANYKFTYYGPLALRQIPLREMELHLKGVTISVDSLPIKFAEGSDANIQTAMKINDRE
uniref:AlNc14C184G8292 protein n=1 Tax=Albugo laibachii Nc14 TaxID=890382 RepID=F0WPE8_9STRA|nr:AlNc14C184G8292 [Albugo laibachii Nc14]|eukprot:CCA23195.1 AlNc14C184G8292 [Albugo laibachii Nc14]